MASESWRQIDKFDSNATDYFCAFLDILGYKVKAEKYFNIEFNLEGRFCRALKSSFAMMNLVSPLVDFSKLEIKFFSDSVIILLPRGESERDSLFGLIQLCAVLSANLAYEDLFVRGGVSFGPHKESHNEDGFSFLASLALQRAYLLESEKAKNPRILVDHHLVGELSNETKIYLAKEKDEYFVHFARQIINSKGDNANIEFKEMLDLQAARAAESKDSVIEKYTWVMDYYYWYLSTIDGLDLSKFAQFSSGSVREFSAVSP